jgi:hypothetical protein
MAFLSLLAAASVQTPTLVSSDWINADSGCTAIACADVNNDGLDDLLATFSDGRLLVSYSLPEGRAGEWKTLNKHAPPNTVGIAVVWTDKRPLREFCLATETQLFSWLARAAPGDSEPRDATWRLKGQRDSDKSGEPHPKIPLRVTEAVSVGDLLWVQTPEREWWMLRTAGSFFIGPYTDPRPSLLPVTPLKEVSSKSEPAQPRWRFGGDLNGDGLRDAVAVFLAGRSPDEHFVVRVTLDAKPLK